MVFGVLALSAAYVLALVTCLLRIRWGYIIGIVLGIEIILQPLVFHVVMGILLVYFCWLGYQAAGRLCNQ